MGSALRKFQGVSQRTDLETLRDIEKAFRSDLAKGLFPNVFQLGTTDLYKRNLAHYTEEEETILEIIYERPLSGLLTSLLL